MDCKKCNGNLEYLINELHKQWEEELNEVSYNDIKHDTIRRSDDCWYENIPGIEILNKEFVGYKVKFIIFHMFLEDSTEIKTIENLSNANWATCDFGKYDDYEVIDHIIKYKYVGKEEYDRVQNKIQEINDKYKQRIEDVKDLYIPDKVRSWF